MSEENPSASKEVPVTTPYYIWVTAMLPRYADFIISELVKLGYVVSPACEGQLVIGHSNQPSVIIALRVESDDPEISINKIYKNLSEIIRNNNIFIYSLIISEATACTWNCSNIIFPETGSKKIDIN